MEETNFLKLPEGCISSILSLTTPLDACRSSTVSKTFQHAVESDVVWKSFLPLDYEDILKRQDSVVEYFSKKELYFNLCEPSLIDGGTKIFNLDKSTGKICYMTGARQLSIVWGEDLVYWTWLSLPDSRFKEVARLNFVWWLEISNKIETNRLSPETTYAAYLVVKFETDYARWYGLGSRPTEVAIHVGDQVSKNIVFLCPVSEIHLMSNWSQCDTYVDLDSDGEIELPVDRGDGWMEVKLGEFYNDVGSDEVSINIQNVKNCISHKQGLIIEGVEIRPIK